MPSILELENLNALRFVFTVEKEEADLTIVYLGGGLLILFIFTIIFAACKRVDDEITVEKEVI